MSTAKAETRSQDNPTDKNPRGIPRAPFISNVEEHIGGADKDVEPVLANLQGSLSKYRYMESNLTHRKASLEEKIPDIKKTLSMVEFLQEKKNGKAAKSDDDDDLEDEDEDEDTSKQPIITTFELNDTLYAEAELEDTDLVYLWLGANVMLSYPIQEAIDLLRNKFVNAEENLANHIADLEYIREQITIMEVNTARVYNWDVKRRRIAKDKAVAGKT